MQWPNRSTLKSNFSELTLEGWLIRNFFSSELPTYMLIPTEFLLSLKKRKNIAAFPLTVTRVGVKPTTFRTGI